MSERVAEYVCKRNKRCSAYGYPFTGALPRDHRLATGGPVRCPRCGDVVTLRRIIVQESKEATQ